MTIKSLKNEKEFELGNGFVFIAVSENETAYLGRIEKDGLAVGQTSIAKDAL